MTCEILILDSEILINNHLVLRINYDYDISKYSLEYSTNSIHNTMQKCTEECNNNDKSEKDYILLLDFNGVTKDKINISKIKKIIKYVQEAYPDKLSKCIVYNYTDMWKFFIDIILSIVDSDTKKKICFRKNLSI